MRICEWPKTYRREPAPSPLIVRMHPNLRQPRSWKKVGYSKVSRRGFPDILFGNFGAPPEIVCRFFGSISLLGPAVNKGVRPLT